MDSGRCLISEAEMLDISGESDLELENLQEMEG